MNYWLNLFSERTWQKFRQAGSDKSGFSPNKWDIVQQMKAGDYLICYMIGGSGFFGILEVSGKPFENANQIWEDEDFESWVPVRVVLALPRDHAVHVKTLHDMSWVRGKSPNYWKGRVAGSPALIERNDAEIITAALEEAKKNPPKSKQQITDYDPTPVYIEDNVPKDDEVEGLNIVLDDVAEEEESKRSWFFIHCYSGYEKKVEHALRQRIDSMGMKDEIYNVLIPTEDEIEVKDGKRRTVEKRVFPGYVMVQMRWVWDEEKKKNRLNDDAWYTVRNTPGVVNFVGADPEAGIQATPLRPEEVKRIMDRMDSEDKVVKVDYKIGERIRIVGGPFNDFPGTVASIDPSREKVRVMVDFFGRETAVVLSFMEVERM